MNLLVTGATGLVGSAVVRAAALRGDRVLAAVRDVVRGRAAFAGLPGVEVVEWDVLRPAEIRSAIDGIVHAAAVTTSQKMIDCPVETMDVTVEGTRNVLSLARTRQVKGVVYLSSMEAYGLPQEDRIVTETDVGPLDHLAPRSSYPLAKRMAEGMCAAYAREYGVPVRIARLAQVIGEMLSPSDNRVIAQFARAVREGRDIVLHTDGASARAYCAISDAVSAILTLLEKGVPGEAYNVANPATYCSIREMAEMLCAAHPPCRVVVDLAGAEGKGYAPAFKMRLSTDKLEALGWKPRVGLAEAYERMLAAWRT